MVMVNATAPTSARPRCAPTRAADVAMIAVLRPAPSRSDVRRIDAVLAKPVLVNGSSAFPRISADEEIANVHDSGCR
jgi:hypothetical protein